MSLEEFVKNITEDDLNRITKEYYEQKNSVPTFQYSKIRDSDLDKLLDIEENLDKKIFNNWFDNSKKVDAETEKLLKYIISENELLIDRYSEEDLKANFIIPILNRVHFRDIENNFRDFYEQKIRYECDEFIFNGTTDFVVSKGLVKSKKPYFFIQEFKKSEEYGNPRPQLLAELISGVELNNWSEIKGAYIIGARWYFVILKKLDTKKYEYFISKEFNGMKLDELKAIYRNLLVIKSEILNNI